ncbi:MAG: hypothetical protein K0U98_08870 [Deltaproteobacteria bacterium]|nr:hypothetical protein [Deltaproteobacteria bacterium]
MDRTKLEAIATYFAVWTLGVLIFLSILASADAIFGWDLLPPWLDKIGVLAIVSLLIFLAACVLISLMLNVSLIAYRVSAIAEEIEGSRKSGRMPAEGQS